MRKKKTKKIIKAFGIVGVESNALYLNSDCTMYEVYYDGFVAEKRYYELKGRGLRVEIRNIKIEI